MTGFVKIEVKDLGGSHEFSAETELHHVSDVDKAMLLSTMIDAFIEDEDIATMFLTVAMVRSSKKEEA